MAFIISPNMQLVIPGVGTEQGPDYASDVNSSLTLIDQHDHSAGKGVPITPSGLSINADLPMSNNNLADARTIRFTPQVSEPSTPLDLGILYESGVDLYFKDGAGNAIRITQSGSVAGSTGTITGLPSGTASASYSAGTFVFQAATLTPANIDGGSFIFRNNVASSKGLTLAPPNAMGADFTLVLPPIPASTKIMTLDSSGNMAANYDVDNATLEVSSNTLQVKAQGIQAENLAPMPANTGTVGSITYSNSCGTFSTSSGSFVTITNLSAAVVSSGAQRPHKLLLTGTNENAAFTGGLSATGGIVQIVIIDGGGNPQGFWTISSIAGSPVVPVCLETYNFAPSAGSTTYTAQIKTSGSSVLMVNCRLIAYEI